MKKRHKERCQECYKCFFIKRKICTIKVLIESVLKSLFNIIIILEKRGEGERSSRRELKNKKRIKIHVCDKGVHVLSLYLLFLLVQILQLLLGGEAPLAPHTHGNERHCQPISSS